MLTKKGEHKSYNDGYKDGYKDGYLATARRYLCFEIADMEEMLQILKANVSRQTIITIVEDEISRCSDEIKDIEENEENERF